MNYKYLECLDCKTLLQFKSDICQCKECGSYNIVDKVSSTKPSQLKEEIDKNNFEIYMEEEYLYLSRGI